MKILPLGSRRQIDAHNPRRANLYLWCSPKHSSLRDAQSQIVDVVTGRATPFAVWQPPLDNLCTRGNEGAVVSYLRQS